MKTSFFPIVFLSISFLASCNNSKIKAYKVSMISETLNIDKTSIEEQRDYEGIISFKNYDYDYRLPSLVSVYIGDVELDSQFYTYNANTGALLIPKNNITSDINIKAERTNLDGYRATFICDSHIKVSFYKTRDYSMASKYTDFAYARDKETGELLKDGAGEINFKIDIDEDYDIDLLWVKGLYKNCNDKEETKKDDVYRITKIRSDLEVNIKTKKTYCKKLAASNDLNNNLFLFSWDIKNKDIVDHIDIDVTASEYTEHFETTNNSFIFEKATKNKMYNFTFTPILKNGTKGSSIVQSRMLTSQPKTKKISRIEIVTKNSVLPICHPVLYSSLTISRSEYTQSNITIYDCNNQKTYETVSDYSGSKIKVRGNSSAYYYPKKPYKIKLTDSADLLAPFRKHAKTDVNYKNKNWVLLATTQSRDNNVFQLTTKILKTPIGFTVSNSFEFDFIQEFEYVSLYINNDYQGIYILCEGAEKGNGTGEKQSRYRVDDSGFIVENDLFWNTEDLWFDTPLTSGKICRYTFKYPDTDDINKDSEQYSYAKNAITTFENYLINKDDKCFDYFDIDSLAKWILTHDVLSNNDGGGSNMFLYKKDNTDNTKIYMGSPWDFDCSESSIESFSPYRRASCFYYPNLFKLDTFKNHIKTTFNDYKKNIKDNIMNYLDSLLNSKSVIDDLLLTEATRWNCEFTSLEDQINSTKYFYNKHFEWLEANN